MADFFYDFVWSFRHFIKFNNLGLLHLPPNQQFSNRKAQEPGKDREPLLVPFGMSSCQCSEKRTGQVMMVMTNDHDDDVYGYAHYE